MSNQSDTLATTIASNSTSVRSDFSPKWDINTQEWSLSSIFNNSYNNSPLSKESIEAFSLMGKVNYEARINY